jgi:anaerobic selenocysteine-containing dehydrogenase
VVSFSSFLDETAERADLVLPDSLFLERWQDDGVTCLAGFTCYSLGKPATAPRHATRDTADVVLQLAAAIGGPLAKALPWSTFDEALRAVAKGLFDARRGYLVSTAPEESLRHTLERQGYWIAEFRSFDKFFAALVGRGAWWDSTSLPAGRRASFATASGRFEFHAPALQKLLSSAEKDGALSRIFGDAETALPAVAFPPVPQGGAAFPLRLNTYHLPTGPQGGARNQPWLLEQPAVHVRAAWKNWVEIHPRTAAALHIENGELVEIESPKGSIRLEARLYPGTREDVINVPLTGGGWGQNPIDLVSGELDLFHGIGVLGTTRVRLRRA